MEDDPVYVETTRVACDGGGGPLGHPRVFLEMGDGDAVVCPYCSRRFIRADRAPAETDD